MSNKIFFRPPWTCGKYNAEKHVAIMFNLLSRMNYFFEEESADVVGMVLAAGRGGKVSIDEVSDKLMIADTSIKPFFEQLCSLRLLSEKEITDEVVAEYRKECLGLPAPPAAKAYTERLKEEGVLSASQAYADVVCERGVVYDVAFELTYRCFEQCIHCYNPGASRNETERNGRGDTKELSLEDYKNIIDDLCDHGLVAASLTGGDPFMHPFVWQIIDYLYQKDIVITILTNGIGLLGKEQRLANYFPYHVQCSLYSGEAQIHDSITRTHGSWRRTVSVMDKLHELGVPIDIACPLMQNNLKSYHSVKSYIKKYGSSNAFDVMLTDSLDGDKCVSHHLRLTPEQLEVVLMDEDVIQHINISSTADDNYTDKDITDGAPCGACKNSLCINPNGDVTPCVAFNKVLGNVLEKKVSEIAMTNLFIEQWLQTKADDYKECFTHKYCDYCIPFCPGNNYNDRGEPLNGGENNCYLAKIRYNTRMKILAGEDVLHGKTIEERINELSVTDDKLQHEYIEKGKLETL